MSCGFLLSSLYLANSLLMMSRSSSGSRPSQPEISSTCSSSRVRDMAQEFVTKACAFACALDQAGDIRQHKAVRMRLDHAEVRQQGGKVVIRDLGLCSRQHRQNRRLAHVGEAYPIRPSTMVLSSNCTSKISVRTPGLAKFGAWQVQGVAKWLFPQPPRPPWSTARNADLLNIRNDLTGIHVANQRAGRNLDDQVLAACRWSAPGRRSAPLRHKICG